MESKKFILPHPQQRKQTSILFETDVQHWLKKTMRDQHYTSMSAYVNDLIKLIMKENKINEEQSR